MQEANLALEVTMEIIETQNREEIQVQENFHNKEEILKEVKEILKETEEVKLKLFLNKLREALLIVVLLCF